MFTATSSSYTTTDLRRSEVVDEAFTRPVSVRDGKTGNLLMMVPQTMINRSNEVARYMQLFTRVVVECQRADPSSVGLDQAAYIVDWTPVQRLQFVRDFAEALSASINEDDPAAVKSFIRFMAGANSRIPAHFHSSFIDGERALIDAHMSAR